MDNIKASISNHNRQVLKNRNLSQIPSKSCNCRIKSECPLDGNCLVRSVVYKAFIKAQIQCDGSRYFARQLLNKHAKNYENVEQITKFLLSTKVGLKINKTSQQNKIGKTLSITETMFLPYFLSHLYFLIAIVQNTNMASHLVASLVLCSQVPSPQSAQVSGDQHDSVDSTGQLGSAACNWDVQLCRHGPATVLIEFLNNRLCNYGVFC